MGIDSLERLERLLAIAQQEGIHVRSEWLGGIRGGLVRIGAAPVLFIDDSLDLQEQLRQASAALSQLDWHDSQWWDEMQNLMDLAQDDAIPHIERDTFGTPNRSPN